MSIRLPRQVADHEVQENFDHLARLLHELTSGTTAYTPTNVSTDRAFDADSTTLAEVADVLGTLIADLQGKGVIG